MAAISNIDSLEHQLQRRASFAEVCAWLLGLLAIPSLFLQAWMDLSWPLRINGASLLDGYVGIVGYLLLFASACLGILQGSAGGLGRSAHVWSGSKVAINALLMLGGGLLVLGLPLLAGPALLGIGQLHFYRRRRVRPSAAHSRGIWWGSAVIMNGALAILVIASFGVYGLLPALFVCGIAYNSVAAGLGEHDLAERRRWADLVGPNLDVPIVRSNARRYA